MADFFDRFNGTGSLTAHTSDSGDSWGPSGTGPTISGGALSHPGVPGEQDYLAFSTSWSPPSPDYGAAIVYGSDYRNLADADSVGLALRAFGVDLNNWECYAIYITKGTPDFLNIYHFKIVSGSFAGTFGGAIDQLGTTQNLVSQIATGDTLAATISGSSTPVITVYRNGTQIYQVTDTSGFITIAGHPGTILGIFNSADNSHTDVIRTIWAGSTSGPSAGITPGIASVMLNSPQTFSATGGLPNETFNWAATNGSVSPSSGTSGSTTYTAPGIGSSDFISWTSADLPTHQATESITLVPPSPRGLLVRPQPNLALLGQ